MNGVRHAAARSRSVVSRLCRARPGPPRDPGVGIPRTVEGLRQGGIIGAFSGIAEGVLTICGTLDGEEVRLLADVTAAELGAGDDLAHVRAIRKDACRKVGAVSAVLNGVAVPLNEAHNSPD